MIKRCMQYCFLAPASLLWAWWRMCSLALGRERAFLGISQFLALFPGISGSMLRAAFYHLAFENTPQDLVVGFLSTFSHPGARLGAHVSISPGCNIGLADIGEHCLIGLYVSIASGRRQHDFTDANTPIRLQGGKKERVTIGRDCWIGNLSVIMADVGEGAVVAAGSVVIHPVQPFDIVGGNPARVLKSRLGNNPLEAPFAETARGAPS